MAERVIASSMPAHAKQSLHRLIPRLRGGKGGLVVRLHQICHNEFHADVTETERARDCNTVEAPRVHPRMAGFLRWVARRPPDFHARSAGGRRER